MLYLHEPLIYTDADVIVYPFVPKLDIPRGSLHEAVAVIAGSEYLIQYTSAVRAKVQHRIPSMLPGGIFVTYVKEGDWAGRWLIGIPMVPDALRFEHLRGSFLLAMQAFKKTDADAMAVQIPMIPCDWSEDVQEALWAYTEQQVLDDAVPQEVWVYTDEYETTVEDSDRPSEERELIEEYMKAQGMA